MKHATAQLFSSLNRVLLLTVMMSLFSCHNKPDPEPILPPEEEETTIASRTILVYMVANNSLGTNYFDSKDISEIRKATMENQFGNGRVIIYHSTSKSAMLKECRKDGGTDTLKIYNNILSSVQIERMRNVIEDVKTIAPAYDYGMVLWSHATGWLQDGIDQPTQNGLRSYGIDGNLKMNITSLAKALENMNLSFVYFDCCYMGSVETLYELRKCVPYFVASPTEDPANGMPYDQTIRHLLNTDISLEAALIQGAKTTFNYYNDVFVQGDCPCTMTVVKSEGLDKLAKLTKEIFSKSEVTVNPDYTYQKFKSYGTCYYFDLDQYVESLALDPDQLEEWRHALDETIIYKDATPYIWYTLPIERCCGLSTYILSSVDDINTCDYASLSWYGDVAKYLFTK